jgi:ABC-type transport system involved in Fe-S cluster assembly fused permease/ATPase subunit
MIAESLQNYYNVQIFNSKKFELSKYTSIVRERISSSSLSQEYLAKLNLMQKSVIVGGSMFNIMLCLWGVYHGTLSAGDIILLTNIMFQVFGPLSNLGMIYQKWQESFLEINELLELFELKSEVVESEDAKEFELKNGDIQFIDTDLSFGNFQSVN